jgi:hypothetical protein
MKIITIIAAMVCCFGCATAPQPPSPIEMVDAIMNHGMTADQVNQTWADYRAARAEYEQTASYKSIPYLVAPLLILGGALGDMPYYGCRGSGYGCLPSKAIINTSPTGSGGTTTTIKWYP